MSAASAATGGGLQTPGLRRRLACLLYEALLLFGVGLVSGALGTFALKLTDVSSTTARDLVLQLVGIVVYGAYFVWFWTRRGQTLPMQTWRIKLVTAQGGALTVPLAIRRYFACALWIAPAYTVAKLNHWPLATMFTAIGSGIFVYALLALLHPQRQFWHDALCGTRLVTVPAGQPVAGT